MKYPYVAIVIFIVASAMAADAPIVREAGVIYLSDFEIGTTKLRVIEPAPTSFDPVGQRYAGTLRPGQEVELLAVSETPRFRVRGRAQQGRVIAWVDPAYLTPVPDGFLSSLRASEERRLAVDALIAAGEVAIGMTLGEVQRSIGRPNKRSTRKDESGTSNVWEYVRYANIPQQTTVIGRDGVATIGTTFIRTPIGTMTVNFKDSVVESIDASEGTILSGMQTTIVAPPLIGGFGILSR